VGKKTSLPVKLKYELYEASVQEADVDVNFFATAYEEQCGGKKALDIREDFCGTHWLCCEWIKSDPKRTAVGIDLSDEPLEYGRQVHEATLSKEEKTRLKTIKQNVKEVTKQKFDIVVASNFSYFIFKQRSELLDYFKSVRASIKSSGLFVFDHFGGPGSADVGKEKRNVKVDKKKYKYIWHAERANLFTAEALFHIHFQEKESKKMYEKAFSYDWRMWTVPELRDIALEAGFKKITIYKDIDGEYTQKDFNEEDDDSWLLQIVAHP